MTTLVSLWTDIRRRLEHAGLETPVIDARLLVEAGAGVARLDIITDPRRELTDAQVDAAHALAERRLGREPLAHIVGHRDFWKQQFKVSRDVLIPRPETEFVVEAALKALPFEAPSRVLDLGVGSGAILVSILADRPLARGVGVDISPEALAIARANAEAHGLSARIEFMLGDWDAATGPFDMVVANPPYIPTGEIDGLAPEVARHEPRLALDGGPDGLAPYRVIVPLLPSLLKPGGAFALEVGAGQAEAVSDFARQAGLEAIAVENDLAGIARVVKGLRPGTETSLGG